ncbi:MAG: hypothetical protein U0P30_11745 [Vicinamibacterales bacterium]
MRDGGQVIVAHAIGRERRPVEPCPPGAIDTSWNPRVSPQVVTLSGGVLYIGGFFTTVAGQPRPSLAALDPATAALLPWNPGVLTPILRMAPSNTGGVFISGLFEALGPGAVPRWRMAEIDTSGAVTPWVAATQPDDVSLFAAGNGGSLIVASSLTATGYVTRAHLAAFDLTTGGLLPWAPSADGPVDVLGAVPGRVTIGGRFDLDGLAAAGSAAVDASSGVRLAWAATAPGSPSFSDGEWFYWAVGLQPSVHSRPRSRRSPPAGRSVVAARRRQPAGPGPSMATCCTGFVARRDGRRSPDGARALVRSRPRRDGARVEWRHGVRLWLFRLSTYDAHRRVDRRGLWAVGGAERCRRGRTPARHRGGAEP